ncbi:YceI family protein [Arenimonas donghaensis]|uniref:Lipid/polyisoprenoid-binding YceI-like domain-containing protein n=1 Tax=Arenimonas donghaensis DSM 18148 = HO3-R19 TaxID=1121014 RepID=A0A087MKD8_9GAMM|nr:YceI family protein [Arenimonas donghaensis]KFL37341.1 hypothetical protein N788_10095 [Arenimonas donghaensis DSM 18148 = HO3-R19]
MKLKTLVLAGLFAMATLPAFAADAYKIDPAHTQVLFSYNHLGFSNITGRFDRVESEFAFDAADPSQSSLSVSIPVDSISTGVAKFDEHLLGADFFDVGKYPTATFTSTAVTVTGEDKLAVAGDLTIHGVTRPVVMDVTINKIADHPMSKKPAAGFDARIDIKRSEFGLGAFAMAASDDVRIAITVEAQKAE